MKTKLRFILGLLMILSFVILISCDKDDDEDKKSPGTITVSISGASAFDGHNVLFSIYDSGALTNGMPAGTMLAIGYFTVTNGAGSVVAVDPTTQAAKTFDAGDYYIGGIVDMDDSITVGGTATQTPTNPDKVMAGLKLITVDGDTTKALTANDFPITGEQALSF